MTSLGRPVRRVQQHTVTDSLRAEKTSVSSLSASPLPTVKSSLRKEGERTRGSRDDAVTVRGEDWYDDDDEQQPSVMSHTWMGHVYI